LDGRLGIIDCDIHPYPKAGALNAYLSERWRKHLAEYGKLNTGPYADRGTYPRFSPNTSRRDAWPPSGGPPGSDVGFIRDQMLDPYGVASWSRFWAGIRHAIWMRRRRFAGR
jgi:hypothetical protein